MGNVIYCWSVVLRTSLLRILSAKSYLQCATTTYFISLTPRVPVVSTGDADSTASDAELSSTPFYLDAAVVAPTLVSVVALVLAVALACFCFRRSKYCCMSPAVRRTHPWQTVRLQKFLV